MNVSLQDLLIAGAHFGHLTRRWNPKMKQFIFMERNGIYVIDLKKTLDCLRSASEKIVNITRAGDRVLFVGTKKQAKDIIKNEAERCNAFYINERWLGGFLTNFTTIKKSIRRLKTIEKMATDGTYDKLTKKEILGLEREREKLDMVLGGIRDMNRLPGAIFIVDTKKESIAVAEARKLHIPVFAIVDTNCDPDLVDVPVPANDDAFKSISLIVRTIADAVLEGMSAAKVEAEDTKAAGAATQKREKARDEVIISEDAAQVKAVTEKMNEGEAKAKEPETTEK